MTLTKFIYKKESSQPVAESHPKNESEDDQILHLKRLLVTLKQHYEKILQETQVQLQESELEKTQLKQALDQSRQELIFTQSLHEEELQALRDQQLALKELLKQAPEKEEDSQRTQENEQTENIQSDRLIQLEQMVSSLKQKSEQAQMDMQVLRDSLKDERAKVYYLAEEKTRAEQEVEQLSKQLALQKSNDEGLETVVSKTSSHHLKQELEEIKRTIVQGAQESKAIETNYIKILNEKIELDHHCKQLETQLDLQSANLASFQAQLQALDEQKRAFESQIMQQDQKISQLTYQEEEFRAQLIRLEIISREKELMQDKYEQLKEEWEQLSEKFDESLDMRQQAEKELKQLTEIANEQENHLKICHEQIDQLSQIKQELSDQVDQLRELLEESESRLKMAQVHLAKKVKENALLNEKANEQNTDILHLNETIEEQKNQLAQLQANTDLYQKQETHLREQLHEALKSTEAQVAKWEKKYFEMADKWQDSEARARTLKTFEEKHHQMQSLLANLGSFMGQGKETSGISLNAEELHHELAGMMKKEEDTIDLFGIKQPSSDKYKTNLFP